MRLKKIILLAVALILTVAISVTATMAYLKKQTEVVQNTFTVGKVRISLDEAKVNEDGKPVDEDGNVLDNVADAPRVYGNEYKLIPGRTYVKDPTVRIAEDSEPCYLILVVYIPEELQDVIYYDEYEDSIRRQMENNGWWGMFYDSYSDDPDAYDVFVYAGGDHIARPGDVIPTFDHILVKEDATYEQLQKADLSEMKITAYGVQCEELPDSMNGEDIWKIIYNAFDPFGNNP